MDADEYPFGHEYWEERYAEPGQTWSGNPNAVLVTEAAGLQPGRALDIGSGEGGDAIWLASLGWAVTGVDIAANALEKARRQAESVDAVAAKRIEWEQHDLTQWSPAPGTFDLVSSQFMHLPEPHRTTLFQGLAAAVAPGGSLLVVGHDATDPDESGHRAHLEALMFSAEDVARAIEGAGLDVVVAESRAREADARHGHGTVHDIVVRAQRPV